MTPSPRFVEQQGLTLVGGVSSFLAGLSTIGAIALAVWLGIAYAPTGLAWLLPTGEKAAWYLTRATGTVAYLLLSGATLWGLLLSTRLVRAYVPPPLALLLHRALSWLAIALAGVHALLLLLDGYYSYRLLDLLLPFLGPYRPGWVGLGTLGFYGLVLVSASFSVRKQIGHQLWRRLHYLSFPLYLLATLHGFMAGSDSGKAGMRAMYLGSALLVLFLTNYRLLSASQPVPSIGAE
jgi:predicted ferric reductase